MPPSNTDSPASVGAEGRALLTVVFLCLALAFLGLVTAERPSGWLRWDKLDQSQTLLILNQYLADGGCVLLMPQSQVSLDGQYAQVAVPGMGLFEVQTHHVGIHTVRALSPITDLPNCHYNPRYVGVAP